MITVSNGLGCSLFSVTLNKPLGWTESLLCVSMQHRLILDHRADTFHPGDFMDSTGNVLNLMCSCYLYRQPWDLNLCTLCSVGRAEISSASFSNILGKTWSVWESANDNFIVVTLAKMLNTDVRHYWHHSTTDYHFTLTASVWCRTSRVTIKRHSLIWAELTAARREKKDLKSNVTMKREEDTTLFSQCGQNKCSSHLCSGRGITSLVKDLIPCNSSTQIRKTGRNSSSSWKHRLSWWHCPHCDRRFFYNDRWNEKQPILILYQSAIIYEPCSPLSISHPFPIFYSLLPS